MEENMGLLDFNSRGRLLRDVPENVLTNSVIGSYCQWLDKNHQLDFTQYSQLWQWSVSELDQFWTSIIDFFDLDVGSPTATLPSLAIGKTVWLPGASLSYAEHALRHSGPQTALVGISQTRERVEISRDELIEQVARCADGLKKLGVKRGDCVATYLPNIPETVVAFLAVASLGAIWVSCAPEFGSRAVIDRLCQVEPTVLLVTAGYRYSEKAVDMRKKVADVRANLPSLRHVINVPYLADTNIDNSIEWHDLLANYHPLQFEKVPFDHPLYILFSSGTTGLPKAIVHGHGGILLEHTKVLGLHNNVKEGDVFFWFSTTGWMVWNYSVSALLLGSSMVCFDGNPMSPDSSNLWRLAEEEKMTFFGNSASFYMACRTAKIRPTKMYNLGAIETVGSTGSTLPVEGFEWIADQFGSSVVIASAAGGTDICSSFISASPMVAIRAGEISAPNLGCRPAAYDDLGKEVFNEPGELVIKTPMPSMPVGFWGDDGTRLHNAYFEQNPGCWTHGDWIVIFDDYASIITGRSDATLNRGGVRLGAADFYSVVEEIEGICDSMIIHLEDSTGGLGQLVLFAVAEPNYDTKHDCLEATIKRRLAGDLSPRHVPDQIAWLSAIPCTLTGKKIEMPVKKLLQGVALEKVTNIENLNNAHALEEILELRMSGRFSDKLKVK